MRDPANVVPSQSTLILDRLRQSPGEWVDMPALAQASGAYAVHSRVAELRSEGHRIECRIEGHRPRRSKYRLVAAALAAAAAVTVSGCRAPELGSDPRSKDLRAVDDAVESQSFIFRHGRWERMGR